MKIFNMLLWKDVEIDTQFEKVSGTRATTINVKKIIDGVALIENSNATTDMVSFSDLKTYYSKNNGFSYIVLDSMGEAKSDICKEFELVVIQRGSNFDVLKHPNENEIDDTYRTLVDLLSSYSHYKEIQNA